MGTFGIIGLALLCGLALWLLISPKSVYWLLQSWLHRDPDANEPSDIAYLLWRITGGLGLIVFVGMGWALVSGMIADRERTEAVEACERELVPALLDAVPERNATDADLSEFAAAHGLKIDALAIGSTPGADDGGISLSYYTFSDAEDRDVMTAIRNADGTLEANCLGS